MSWNDYSNYIVAENACTSGYVLGLTDGAIWAATSGETALPQYALKVEDDNGVEHTVTVDETKALLAALNNTNNNDGGKGVPPAKEFPQGLRISNVKYYLSSRDEENNIFYYKSNGGGMCIAVTLQTIIIGTFLSQNQSVGQCNARVETLQKSLIENNF